MSADAPPRRCFARSRWHAIRRGGMGVGVLIAIAVVAAFSGCGGAGTTSTAHKSRVPSLAPAGQRKAEREARIEERQLRAEERAQRGESELKEDAKERQDLLELEREEGKRKIEELTSEP